MPGSLKRVLRLRALREDWSRMEVEAEAARLRAIDLGAAEAAQEARASREQFFWEIRGRRLQGEVAGTGPLEKEAVAEQSVSAKREIGSGGGENGNPADGCAAEGWRRAESAWETAAARQSGCEERRPAQQLRVDRAQVAFLADRRERMQAETLVDGAAARERAEQARRDQRGLDDWFQSWAKRVRQEEKLREKA